MTIKRLTLSALALLALFAVAAPAAATAKPAQVAHYEGETDDGEEISFDLIGKRLSGFDGYISTTCVPTHGTPLTATTEFNPPGSYLLGKTGKASNTEYISYKGDVTKNYTIELKQDRRNHYVAGIHVNYSYEEVTGSSGLELEQHFYICQGDDSFDFKIEAPKPKR